MQNPFKKVAHTETDDPNYVSIVGTNLLFDFFGLFVGLSSVTIFILYAIKMGLWLKLHGLGILSKNFSGQFSIFYYGRRWRFGGRGGKWFEFIRRVTAVWIGAGICITLLVIFFIGMLRSAQKAWDAARLMFATYIIVGGLLFTFSFIMYCRLLDKRVWRR